MTEAQGDLIILHLGRIDQMAMLCAMALWIRFGWDWAFGIVRRHGPMGGAGRDAR